MKFVTKRKYVHCRARRGGGYYKQTTHVVFNKPKCRRRHYSSKTHYVNPKAQNKGLDDTTCIKLTIIYAMITLPIIAYCYIAPLFW